MNLTTKYEEKTNEEKQGIELYFEAIPTYLERKELKENGFRWNPNKNCWYKKNEITLNKLQQVKNELGIKVGDVFSMNWGYEQTNVDFFQVVALKGKTQVIIRECIPSLEEDNTYSHGMASDRVYDTTKVAYVKNSTFVKDNEKGMIKKVCGTKERPYLNMTSFANAYKCNNIEKVYESWYA